MAVLPASIKELSDGTLYCPRRGLSEDIRYMDEHYLRAGGPTELRWLQHKANIVYPKVGETVHIVGKGPGLDNIANADLNGDYPVFCLNEAIHRIASLDLLNELYTVQQDIMLKQRCWNPRSTLFANVFCCGVLHAKATYYMPKQMGLTNASLSVQAAMYIAKQGGAKEAMLWAFDGAKGESTAYAKCIGTDPRHGGNPIRFTKHGDAIREYAMLLEMEVIFM